jgi:hypothetical protein
MCTSGNYAQKWITKLYNYNFIALARLAIQNEGSEEKHESECMYIPTAVICMWSAGFTYTARPARS